MKRIVCCICLLFCFASRQIADARTYRIYIDPGHFKGNGASFTLDREPVTEEEVTLAVALKLRDLLKDDVPPGVTWEVEMSRETPHSKIVDLGERKGVNLNDPKDRARHADQFEAELFLSIHCNAGRGEGTETFWADRQDPNPHHRGIIPSGFTSKDDEVNKDSKRFAKLVQDRMVSHGGWGGDRVHGPPENPHLDRLYKNVKTGGLFFESKGRFPGYGGHIPILFVLREVPGCLNEIGFLDTRSDLERLVSPYWQQRTAEAYRDAIFEYFGVTPPIYFDITVEPGVNLFSIPGTPANTNPVLIGKKTIALLPVDQLDPAERAIRSIDELQLGQGYRVHAPYRDTVMLSYFPEITYTITLERGFNMIGSVSGPASFASTVRSANRERRKVDERLWTWNAEQQRSERVDSDLIQPRVGYLVLAYEEVEITVSHLLFIGAPSVISRETQLFANFPNPFNPETWIPFTLRQGGEVTVSIYTTSGHRVRTLRLGHLKPGSYATRETAAHWDGRNEEGDKVASGIYFYTLQTDTFSDTKKMVLLK